MENPISEPVFLVVGQSPCDPPEVETVCPTREAGDVVAQDLREGKRFPGREFLDPPGAEFFLEPALRLSATLTLN